VGLEVLTFIILAGFIISLIGLLLIVLSLISGEREEERVEGGGVLIVGPLPIVFGSSRKAALIAAIIGVIMIVIVLALTLVMAWWTT
jgi:uncharacterized protein (TIGR00304 family)